MQLKTNIFLEQLLTNHSSTLAEINLKNAVLTDRGRNKLAQLLTQSAKEN